MDKKTGNRAPRQLNRLSDAKVRTLAKNGYHCDGGGLYLQVHTGSTGTVRKSWIFRYRWGEKLKDMGLGSYIDVSLAEAREKATELRQQLNDGVSPMLKRAEDRATKQVLDDWTFERCAFACHEEYKAEWKNPKHADQWINTLRTYAFPKIGSLPVSAIEGEHIVELLQPIWRTKHETAFRVKGRIRSVLKWAACAKLREDRNPVDSVVVEQTLRRTAELTRFESHESLPYTEIANTVANLRQIKTDASLGLEFLILTATRSSEVTGATWEEINLEERVWTIPQARMKAGIEHWVPLSKQAIALLEKACPDPSLRKGPIFRYRGKPLSDAAFRSVMERLGLQQYKPHGMRATFRTWGSEETGFDEVPLEHALAHGLPKSSTQRRYDRSTMIKKRKPIMRVWADYCDGITIPEKYAVEDDNNQH